jgi:hypothetical protein
MYYLRQIVRPTYIRSNDQNILPKSVRGSSRSYETSEFFSEFILMAYADDNDKEDYEDDESLPSDKKINRLNSQEIS